MLKWTIRRGECDEKNNKVNYEKTTKLKVKLLYTNSTRGIGANKT